MCFSKVLVLIFTAIIIGLVAGTLYLQEGERNPPVADGAVVLMKLTVTEPESRIVISSGAGQFVPGHHELPPNVEKAITGMKKGEAKRIHLSPDEAFGAYDESKKRMVSIDRLPGDVKPGTVLETEEGAHFVVVERWGSLVSIDFNHPLAGKHLVFDVKILNVDLSNDDYLQFVVHPQWNLLPDELRFTF